MDAIRTTSTPEAAVVFMTDSLIPCAARRDMTEQVSRQLPTDQSVIATAEVARLHPRYPDMVNFTADATIRVRQVGEATLAAEQGVVFDTLYNAAWVFLARRNLVLGDLAAARENAAEAERVQAVHQATQQDFSLIRNLYADIGSAFE